ncbi:MAG: hypothetical protein MJ137_09685 [Clostridia bacterium]|nr:hypothetical protein [Clostridia bacterium]
MASKTVNAIRMKGKGTDEFVRIFKQMNSPDENGADSGFRGGIDADGNFTVVRKGSDKGEKMNYDARLEGRVYIDEGDTVIEYSVHQSAVFIVSFIVIGIITAVLDVFALIRYFTADNIMLILPASFFTLCVIIMSVITAIKPDVRALEKQLLKIAEAYAE